MSAVAGDDVAFARIVAAHEAEMHRICVAVCGDQSTAADAVQSAWAIAWRKLESMRQPERLRPWLVAIAVNETRQLMRKRHRRSQIEVAVDPSDRPGGVDPSDRPGGVEPETGIDGLDLDRALLRLDPDDRALLAMRYIAGFDSNELAIATGLSPSGTRSRLERLLARLRKELE
ncbi:MAG: RNA polymerase sigma factor [Chloroflexota bacterium]